MEWSFPRRVNTSGGYFQMRARAATATTIHRQRMELSSRWNLVWGGRYCLCEEASQELKKGEGCVWSVASSAHLYVSYVARVPMPLDRLLWVEAGVGLLDRVFGAAQSLREDCMLP
jgi:hypothetical protein